MSPVLVYQNRSRLRSTHLLQQKFRMQILCIILCPQILSRDNNLLLCYRKSGCRILCIFFLPKNLGQISICLHTHSSDVVIREPSCWPWVAAISWWCSDPLWVTLIRLWLYLFHVFFRWSKSSSLKLNVFMLSCSSRRVSDNRRDIFMGWWAASSLDASCRAPFIEPLEDVIKHKVDILIWLTQ